MLSSGSCLEIAPISRHSSSQVPFSVIPQVVQQIDDEQRALYVHAVIGLKEREIGKLNR